MINQKAVVVHILDGSVQAVCACSNPATTNKKDLLRSFGESLVNFQKACGASAC